MKRSTPLRRDGEGARRFADQRSGLARGGGLKRSGPLKSRSKERAKFMKDERVPLITALVEAGVGCEIGPMIVEVGLESPCTGRIEGMHERRKRSAGGSLRRHANLVPACNMCNGWVEDVYPTLTDEQKAEFGSALVVTPGNPEYILLGKRHDQFLEDDDGSEPDQR